MKAILQPLYTVYRSVLKHPKYRWIAILGSVAYLFSPVDLITDFVPFVGWIDDGLIATLLVTEVSQLLLEQRQRKGKDTETMQNTTESVAESV